MEHRSWDRLDILFISADAYVDHPSFGPALLCRLLESKGFRTGIIAQPKWDGPGDFLRMGRPALCTMIGGGNIDSMVAHYTANNKPRSTDAYSPGGKAGCRPDRAILGYASRARQAFGSDMPLIIGGLEASLRRGSHYDFWSDKIRKPILLDAKADLLVYGMGERQTVEIATRLADGQSIGDITDVRGTCFSIPIAMRNGLDPKFRIVDLPSFEQVSDRDKKSNRPTETGKQAYAKAFSLRMTNENPLGTIRLAEACMNRLAIQNPPAFPLSTEEFDSLYELPYTYEAHPDYAAEGGVPALEEVKFSLTSNRGCFGSCSFCAISSHQDRMIQVRSKASLVREAERMTRLPGFKGYIHDVGGPTANFQGPACKKQGKAGPCPATECLFPHACGNLEDSHARYLEILKALESVPDVKKVFIRSGLRFDYLLTCCKEPTRSEFLDHMVQNNISGQLKVAPEHVDPQVLDAMGKPPVELYEQFRSVYEQANAKARKRQYLIPYFIAAHPGSTLESAIVLALHMKDHRFVPDQVQEFYPTPGTVSTCMYYTGLDPRPGRGFRPIHIPKGRERSLQRALLQYDRKENRHLVAEALHKAGRDNLIPVLRETGRR